MIAHFVYSGKRNSPSDTKTHILSYKGKQIGKSIKEGNCEKIINEIFETSKNYSCEIIYPEDVLVGKNMNDKSQMKELNDIAYDDLILDIGPKTLVKVKDIIEKSKTVLWNGPAGYFENQSFAILLPNFLIS